MGSLTTFPPKALLSNIFISFDYTSALVPGETISGASVFASVFSGTDANPQSMVVGAATVEGMIVIQEITGGVAGVLYLFSCQVATSLGNSKILQGHLAVLSDNPYGA